ncbi:MAG: hypothetical protein WKF58_02430 [Ilumatobacteraceae bacterium]
MNSLAARGWKRGTATGSILLGVVVVFLLFVTAIGTLVGTQVADLLSNSEQYITDTVDVINDTFGTDINPQEAIDTFNDPDGPVQEFIDGQQDKAFEALGQRRSARCCRCSRCCCSRSTSWPTARSCDERSCHGCPSAVSATCCTPGRWRSTRRAATSTRGRCWRCCRRCSTGSCSSRSARRRRSRSRLWVGVMSQFLPVVGTYIAGVLPVVLTFLDSPLKAAAILGFIVVYQQIENYLFAPGSRRGRWSCTLPSRSAPRSPARRCSARSGPCSRCLRRRWCRR